MPEPVRVAFAIDTMEAGGTELNAVRLAERLNRDRFDIRVVCMRKEGPLAARYEALGVPVESFPMRSLYGPSAVRQGVRLVRYLRTQRIAIVHAHDIYSNVFAVPWARLAGARTIASRRWWEGFQATRWRLATRMSYRAAHAVLANSTAIGRLLVEAEGVPPSRVVVVPNFLDGAAFERPDEMTAITLGRELRLDDGGPVVGIVANLLPVKDHAALLRAAVILRPRWPRLRVVLVGDGPCRPALERLAIELGLGETIVFAGRRSSLPNLHQLFDISVLCSTSEGLPNSILEAMAAARPVVATKVGAVADAVLDGETGILVRPSDPVQLAAALEQLLADPARAARYGEAGAARARANYTADAALESLEGLYHRLVARAVSRDSRPTARIGYPRGTADASADSVRRPTASRAS